MGEGASQSGGDELRARVAVLEAEVATLRRAERRLGAQNAVTQILADAPSLADATPRILQAICATAGWEVGGLWRIDTEVGVLRCVALWHRPELALDAFGEATRAITFASGVGLPGRVWASGRPAWLADVTLDPNFPRGPAAAQSGLHAAFAFPVLLGGEVFGVLDFFSREVREPDDDFLAMLAELGTQIGQHIARKRAEEALEHTHRELVASERATGEALAELQRQLELTETQRVAIRELSAPVLEVGPGVLALPVIGPVDEHRSSEITDGVLDAVLRKHARFVIIDVTGVDHIDTDTADHLLSLVRAVELLGAQCMLTGIRASVAHTIVRLGVDLASIPTLRTLADGLRECLRLVEAGKRAPSPRRSP